MPKKTVSVVTRYVRLWPREVFYIKAGLADLRSCLSQPGVYILYHNFDVFYVGQGKRLFNRLQSHALQRYWLWDHFSAFFVPKEHLNEVEAMIIAATPRTFNKSVGRRIEKVSLPPRVRKLLLKSREISGESR